jgi:hypothetical protein
VAILYFLVEKLIQNGQAHLITLELLRTPGPQGNGELCRARLNFLFRIALVDCAFRHSLLGAYRIVIADHFSFALAAPVT